MGGNRPGRENGLEKQILRQVDLGPAPGPEAQDPILSSMRLRRGREPILSTQRISLWKIVKSQ